MKAMRKEDFESEVDYIYSIVEVLKDFTEPQQEALMLVAMMHSKEELDAVEVFQRYVTSLHAYQRVFGLYEKTWSRIEGDLIRLQFDEKQEGNDENFKR